MHIHFSIESALTPNQLWAYVLDEHNWPQLIVGLEKLGALWRYGDDLYELSAHASGTTLVLRASCPARPRYWFVITIVLTNTGISTRIDLTIELNRPFWQRRNIRAAFELLLERACAVLYSSQLPQTDDFVKRFPRTAEAFAAMNASEHLQRIARLDQTWNTIRRGESHAPATVHTIVDQLEATNDGDFELIYAGGGLGLLHAAVMAVCYKRRVLLFDRGEVGCAHREWNISHSELAALVDVGLFSWHELAPVIMNEYQNGLVRFHAAKTPTELWLPATLNIALDAGMLLQLTRRKLEQAGGIVLDHRLFSCAKATAHGPTQIQVELACADGTIERYRGRLLLDGMGSTSPLALQRFAGEPFAGVCPTVGTVVRGLEAGNGPRQHNAQIGDILLSIDDAQRGQQYMWEGFPGRDDELTVYLFYYDTLNGRSKLAAAKNGPTLLELFEDYFSLLPSYKQPGPDFAHLKPVYGYIPARHSVRRQEAPLLRGVLPVGDSAAQQSPLTFCGFGSHVRNLGRTTSLLNQALDIGLTTPEHLQPISAYQVNVSLNWMFSRFMQPWRSASDVNELQNIFLNVLNELGVGLAERFFRDQMRWSDYHKMILGMFRHHPFVVVSAWQVLGVDGCRQWISDYLRYSGAALLATLARQLGASRREALLAALEHHWPARALQARAALAEWQASSWL